MTAEAVLSRPSGSEFILRPPVSLPEWLTERSRDEDTPTCCGRLRRRSFVEKTIRDAAEFTGRAMHGESIARSDGLLQRIDPRIKLAGLSLALLTCVSLHRPLLIAVLLGFTLTTAAVSRIPARECLARLAVLPVLTALMAVPATLSWITPGDPVISLGHLSPHLGGLAITRQGLIGLMTLTLRAAGALSITVLLTLTTRWSDLLRSLRIFGAPRLFLFILAMVYRYVFLILQVATELFVARKSRSAGEPNVRAGRDFVATTAGMLFVRSHALSEEVYAAMRSRGYHGEPRVLETWRIRPLDLAWLGSVVLTVAALWTADTLHV